MIIFAAILLIPATVGALCTNPEEKSGVAGFERVAGADYIGSRSPEAAGCACGGRACVRRCCPPGRGYSVPARSCVPLAAELPLPFDQDVEITSVQILYGTITCPIEKKLSRLKASDIGSRHLAKDGSLRVVSAMLGNLTYPPERYCVDTFPTAAGEAVLDALVCEPIIGDVKGLASYENLWRSTCMVVSCLFLAATLAVYAALPELRNLHGLVLISYLASLLSGFLVLAALRLGQAFGTITVDACFPMGVAVYVSLTSAFFWLNVMCFDIYWTFSGRRGLALGRLSVRSRFLAYCAYAYGGALLLTALMLALEFSPLESRFLPNFRTGGCFLYGIPKLIYFYGPLLVLCVINIVFFVLTAAKILLVSQQTSVLKTGDSTTHDPRREGDKQRFLLYFKLFAVMGVNWIMEVVSSFFEENNSLFFDITDAFNMLIGVIIFILFVCKRKILKLIKNRYSRLVHKIPKQGFSMTDITNWNGNSKWKNKDPRDSVETVRTQLDNENDKWRQAQGRAVSRQPTTTTSSASGRDELPLAPRGPRSCRSEPPRGPR